MDGHGTITIAAERSVFGPGAAIRLRPGAYVRISVIDNGAGMDGPTLTRAVEPFFSTKGVGKGTGLGLSMVHGLAAQLGGAFELTSVVGQGTRADLYLPVTEASVKPTAALASDAIRTRRRLSVLLVDDEDLVRTGTAEMLREIGHKVHEASGGAQALGLLAGGTAIDVVVSDYMMPRMNGAELASQIKERNAAMPVMIVTGYAGGDLDLGLPQLAKPFRQADLAAALERLVEPAAAAANILPFPRSH
jgi:CheY-like chemotaxis protein